MNKKNKSSEKVEEKTNSFWKKIIGFVVSIALLIFMVSGGVPYFTIIFFIILPFLGTIFAKTNKKSFYKLQEILPTSTIRSVAMGLAEISGKAKMIEPVISKITKKKCIGYIYLVEDIRKDKEGRISYFKDFSETVCNPFFVKDKTGQIKVLPNDLEFLDFEESHQKITGSKRYTEYLLKENMEVLLIGKAGITENNEPVFKKEEIKNVFGIAPLKKVGNYNKLRPLIKSAGYFIYFWIIIVAIILLTPTNLENNMIKFGNYHWEIPFQNTKK
ncbi:MULTISPECIES: hypothetical protein [Pasteurellaceae]|uniref:RING-type E3 ubiquitin transferase n=1 Tax=Pasteurella atlantica TaxID=2827233 RepID=A0AAW8CJJ6_9PAST|nr:hypothetical protein [Pasteurella atlantica]MBR0572956.1 hypothetical protein [Pasteurella atlantica]MDP8038917.1 hypothetical protein [Pasteurella atlantica]MDP8040974.1 hypothetical protein [Pasteurella atlantica]MDP8043110.1 hypothetical protein [Pasteurella atlantica]MDP8045196.1 hypothetical protein [Pasteurella atlantica]